jgi:type VI protein secretion system component Hcp
MHERGAASGGHQSRSAALFGGGEVVVERITLTNAVISKVHRYTPHLGSEFNVHDTDEMEEIQFAFQKITFSNVAGSTSTSDDWTTNTG